MEVSKSEGRWGQKGSQPRGTSPSPWGEKRDKTLPDSDRVVERGSRDWKGGGEGRSGATQRWRGRGQEKGKGEGKGKLPLLRGRRWEETRRGQENVG